MLSTLRQNGLPQWALKISLLVSAAIWGLSTVVIKSTVDEISPAWLVGIRYTGAGIIMGLATLPTMRRRLTADGPAHWRSGAILGVLLYLSYWLNSTGLTDTAASTSSFLTTLYVVIIPFLGWFIIRKKPTRYNIAAALASIAGVGCVAYSGAGSFSLSLGELVTLTSALFLSLHVLYTAKLAPGRSVTVLTVIQFLVAGVLGIITALITGPTPDFTAFPAETWTSLFYLTVFASFIAIALQNAAVARVDPAQAALFLATESVFGVTFSILILSENPSPSSFVGFALIFIAIIISEYLPLRAEKKQVSQTESEATAMEEADAFMR